MSICRTWWERLNLYDVIRTILNALKNVKNRKIRYEISGLLIQGSLPISGPPKSEIPIGEGRINLIDVNKQFVSLKTRH